MSFQSSASPLTPPNSLELPVLVVRAGIAGRVLRIVRDDVLVLGHTSSVQTVLQGCGRKSQIGDKVVCAAAV